MLEELIYDGAARAPIRTKWPEAKFVDASDYIHEGRFEVRIDDTSEDEFYPFAIREGFARACLGFELRLQSLSFPETKNGPKRKDTIATLEAWCRSAKGLPDGL